MDRQVWRNFTRIRGTLGEHCPWQRGTAPVLTLAATSRRTFYRWYDRYLEGGPEALQDRSSAPSRVWNRQVAIECKFDKSIRLGEIEDVDWYGNKFDTALSQLIEAQANRECDQAIIVFDRSSRILVRSRRSVPLDGRDRL